MQVSKLASSAAWAQNEAGVRETGASVREMKPCLERRETARRLDERKQGAMRNLGLHRDEHINCCEWKRQRGQEEE